MNRLSRSLPAILLMLATCLPLEAQLSAPELEDAAEFVRRAARAAVSGSQRIFAESLDVDGLLEGRLGAPAWKGLTGRQREQLRSLVRDYFLRTLAPSRSTAAGEIVWSWATASAAGGVAEVVLGLRFGARTLKTTWIVRRTSGGWQVTDVVLSDPGISIAEASGRALGPEPARRRDRRKESERAAYPRLAGLMVIALLVAVVAPRLPRGKRTLLFLTAAAPAVLFGVDGALAVRRALLEPYALAQDSPREPWHEAEQAALEAQRQGRTTEARNLWARAIALGDRPEPIFYQMGLAARERGDPATARNDFERALSQKRPAPGAAKELAAMDSAEGKFEQADRELGRYLTLAGPDPDSLSMRAWVLANLGRTSEALEAIQQARGLLGDAWRGAELEAQIHARSADAAGAVAALRPLETSGLLDRSALRADPAYLPIATDPVWTAFLNEKRPTPAAKK